ncbi:hypothetical protein N7474_006594 [Penicillium riverlandense]|uniref:uncharacterized protein n=1 Tax=Penicillium riverlandense TaxID=1903569 RepID=UPI00254731F6|nr:uncharacterized protein N7474_006594 [Penicillium riverlandense]KAJ5814817.1 hypothetical protein N7474_006594 [Penicillium riverlandense]
MTTTTAGPESTDRASEIIRTKDNENDRDSEASGQEQERFPVPQPYKLGSLRIPNYRSPYTQVCLAGLTTFLAVGFFGVLAGLGGAGQVNPIIADDANIILYSMFAGVALLSGPIITYFGPKKCVSLGGIGYALYGASFWCYNNTHNKGFVLFGGAACGVGAALLWTSCSVVMLTYSTEEQKGRFISILFAIFYMGITVGGCIPLGLNFHNAQRGSISNGTYAVLTILMALSVVPGLLIIDPQHMVRTDGTKVQLESRPILHEFKNIWFTLKRDPWILMFMPFSFGSLYYGAYQGSDFEVYFFDVRTRALDGFLIGLAQVSASIIFGCFLDLRIWRRRQRAFIGWAILTVFIVAINTCGYFAMKLSNRDKVIDALDVQGGGLASKLITLEFFYGFQDGLDNALAYWLIGCFSNDPRMVATLTGFFKVFGATGSAVAFGQDIHLLPYTTMFGSYFGIILGGVFLLFPLIYFRIHNTEKDVEVE